MSIASQTSRVQYTVTSVGQTLTVPFYFLEAGHVGVVRGKGQGETRLVLGMDYTVTGAGNQSGGSIKLANAAAAVGEVITLFRDGPFTQPNDYPLAGQFPAATIEETDDASTMIDQQLRLQTERSLRVSVTKEPLPPISGELNKDSVLGFDENGNPVVWDKETFKGDKGDTGDQGPEGPAGGPPGPVGPKGEDGEHYWIQLTTLGFLRRTNGSYNPYRVDIETLKKVGNQAPVHFPCMLHIWEWRGGPDYIKVGDYPSFSGSGGYWTPSSGDVSEVMIDMWHSGVKLDSKKLPVETLEKGPKGDPGSTSPPPIRTLSFEANSDATLNGAGNYTNGTTATISAAINSNSNKLFDKWEKVGSSGNINQVANVNAQNTTVSMTANIQLRAKLKDKPQNYQVSVGTNPPYLDGYGVNTRIKLNVNDPPTNSLTVPSGSTVMISTSLSIYIPPGGIHGYPVTYNFDKWEISSGAALTVANANVVQTTAVVNGPGTIVAKFKA